MATVLNDRTPSRLLDVVKEDLDRLFEKVRIEVELQDGNKEFRPVQVYKQNAPIVKAGEDEELQYPQAEFKLINSYLGDQEEEAGKMVHSCLIVLGICDYRYEADAWMQLLSMYEKIFQHYRQNPILQNFEVSKYMELEMQSNDTYPFYFAAMSVKFMTNDIERIDVEDMI